VYVYRDVSDPAPTPPARRQPAADDAAYWYDLLAEDPVPRHEETRGPFEPLLYSTEQPPAEQARQPPDGPRDESPEAPDAMRARKLEQLRDLYLTAEAIGEQNVDKHFDQILAQQRELIAEYFKRSAAARPGGPQSGGPQSGGSGPAVASPRDATAEEAGTAAEQPHGW